MYFGFMKNFLFVDSGEQMPVKLISAFSRIPASRSLLDSFRPPEPKNVYSYFLVLSAKTLDSYFLDMMYVGVMKNFLLADCGVQMPVRLILDSWAQKRLIPTF